VTSVPSPDAPQKASPAVLREEIRTHAASLENATIPPRDSAIDAAALPADHPQRGRYTLDELVHVHGEAFVERSYRYLLKRPPDALALMLWLERLQRGDSKIALLGDLRWSAEGNRHGVLIEGLRLRYAFWRAAQWPWIGGVIERVALVGALPAIAREQRRLGQVLHDDDAQAELAELRAEVAELKRRLDNPP
jgi:hypothetical protein